MAADGEPWLKHKEGSLAWRDDLSPINSFESVPLFNYISPPYMFWILGFIFLHDIILIYLLKAFFSDEISIQNTINARNAHGNVEESVPLMTVEDRRREFPNKHGILSFNINELNIQTFYNSQEYHNLDFFTIKYIFSQNLNGKKAGVCS